jgi:2-polyprenyl-6-methoxyphenol hydroxylase-like FAD-dependent oxidoreductase
MNVGLREGEDLAGKLGRIIRGEAPEALLAGYEQAYRDEWRLLLGAKGAPRPGAATAPWVGRHGRQILSSLPASGSELGLLLTQLGLSLP